MDSLKHIKTDTLESIKPDDIYNETLYIDCEYCAEGVHMDLYPNHLYECRLLCPNRPDSMSREYSMEYYLQQSKEEQNLKELFDTTIREQIIRNNSSHWSYEAYIVGYKRFLLDQDTPNSDPTNIMTSLINLRQEGMLEQFMPGNVENGVDFNMVDTEQLSGLDNPEDPAYSELIYIWSITGNFSCNICMQDNYTIYRKLKCNHRLCNSCYLEWFKHNTTCPFCRHVLFNPVASTLS